MQKEYIIHKLIGVVREQRAAHLKGCKASPSIQVGNGDTHGQFNQVLPDEVCSQEPQQIEAAPRPTLPPPSLPPLQQHPYVRPLLLPTPTHHLLLVLLPATSQVRRGRQAGYLQFQPHPHQESRLLKSLWSSSDLATDDDDDDDGEKKAKEEKRSAPASKSQTLSLPPPKNSFGLPPPPPPSSGRQALVDTDTAAAAATATKAESGSCREKAASLGVDGAAAFGYGYCSAGYTADGSSDLYSDVGGEGYGGYGDHNNQEKVESTSYGEKAATLWVDGAAASDYGYYSSDPYCNVGCKGYGGYPQYGSGWGNGAMAAPAPPSDFVIEDGRRSKGKRGRDEVPAGVMEVKQDELVDLVMSQSR